MSAPAVNARWPAPRNTTTRTASSAAYDASTRGSSASMARLIALRFSWLSKMIQPIPSATSVISSPLTSTHTSPPLVVVGSQHVVFVQSGDLAVVIPELSQHGVGVLASPGGRRAY